MKIIFVVIFCIVFVDSRKFKPGCPESVDVHPCTCTNSPFTYLECKHLDDAQVLKKVFYNSDQYQFKEVHIENSAMPYIPHDIFDKVSVHKLYLKHVTVAQLFLEPPNHMDDMRTLHIEETKIVRGFFWKLLEPMVNLRILNVYYNNIKKIGETFSRSAPKTLQQISFYETHTRFIMPGVFQEFEELDRVAFDRCHLRNLSRDIFPTPSNVRFLYFNENGLNMLPDDMFSNMPRLHTVSLRGNQLAVIPPTMFKSDNTHTLHLSFEGNPIICDCRLIWLIRNKPHSLTGNCDLPFKLQGRAIKDLDPEKFHC